jgi:hypothetical protein
MFAWKHSLDGCKGIHLALEVKTFLGNLHLRWVPVWSPALESLDLPLITAIGITRRERDTQIERERERSPTHKRSTSKA